VRVVLPTQPSTDYRKSNKVGDWHNIGEQSTPKDNHQGAEPSIVMEAERALCHHCSRSQAEIDLNIEVVGKCKADRLQGTLPEHLKKLANRDPLVVASPLTVLPLADHPKQAAVHANSLQSSCS